MIVEVPLTLLHVFQGQQDDTGSALFKKKIITGGNSISLEYLKIFFRKVIFKKIKKKKFVLSIANLREM